MGDERRVGSVFSEEAYALGKVLDHSSWQNPREGSLILPRGITGSDVDVGYGRYRAFPIPMFFDNSGRVVLCELSRHHRRWQNLQNGQSWGYESIVNNSLHVAAMCHHSVAPENGRKIDTRYDVDSFQLMLSDGKDLIYLPGMFGDRRTYCAFGETEPGTGNIQWQRFILRWFRDPVRVRRVLIGASCIESIEEQQKYFKWTGLFGPLETGPNWGGFANG